MKTITEDYVSLETAKLLKEKGFECNYKMVIALEDIIEERFEGRTCVGKELILAGTFFTPEFGGEYETYDYSPNLFTASAPCPTQAMAMKWLREDKKILISIFCHIDKGYWFCIQHFIDSPYKFATSESIHRKEEILGKIQYYNSYEEACEAAIKYCLENLI